MSIRLLIVDDHQLVRSGLRRLLEAQEDMTVEDEAGNAADGIRLARLHKPDVVLLDVGMPGRSGVEAAPEIREAAPDARVLVVSMEDDPSYVRAAFAAGASGYVLKEAADDDLLTAVREVAGGRNYVDPALGARLAAADAAASAGAEADPLSAREHEVLRMLALGYTNQEIAKTLFMSDRAVEKQIGSLFQKLGLVDEHEVSRRVTAVLAYLKATGASS